MSEYIVRMPPDMPYEIKAELNAWYVNSEPIVRCRDCVNYSGEDDEIYPKWCMQMNITEVEPDGFCAWAERKEVDA